MRNHLLRIDETLGAKRGYRVSVYTAARVFTDRQRDLLTQTFGGVTFAADNDGRWTDDGMVYIDDIVIAEHITASESDAVSFVRMVRAAARNVGEQTVLYTIDDVRFGII